MREAGKQGRTPVARPLRVLIVEDQPADAELSIAWLKRAGYTLSFEIVATPEQFKQQIEIGKFDLMLSDHNLRTWTGMDVLATLRQSGQEVPFIVVTGTLGDEAAVEYIKQGAADYVLKHRLDRLPVVVGRALREKAQREEAALLQEEIFAAKKEWELTFDQVPDAVFLLDAEGLVRRANQAAAEFLGMDFRRMIGRPAYELVNGLREPGTAPPSLEEVLNLDGGTRRDIEARHLGKVFEITPSPLRGTSGEFRGAVIVVRNVTEQRRAEAEMRAAKNDWEMTFNTVPDPIIVMDEECRITRANQATSSLCGLQPAQVIGKHCYEVLHQSAEPRPDCPHQQLIQTGSEAHGDLYEPWLDKFFDSSATPIRDRTGALRGCVHVLRDVTDRKRAEDNLRHSEELFQVFMDNSPVMAWMNDTEGRYTYCNQAFKRAINLLQTELIGKTIFQLFAPAIAERLWQDDLAVLSSGKSREFTEPIPGSDSEREVWVLKFPFHDPLGQQLVGGIGIEITERKRLEAQLRQSQKMEAIGQLAGGVAHDFNNLLTIISGYGELLSSGLGSDHPQKGQVKEIQDAAGRAAGLTSQLLAFGRRQVLAPQVLDLNHIVNNMDKMLRRLIGEHIEMITIPGQELGRVRADPGQIEQVIMNLTINARDAMPTGGKLSIETENVILDDAYARGHISVTPGGYVMLAVSDNGCGMDAETQARIFEPFFTTKGLGKGTGLGLATVYGIVKQSGGHIWVYSEPGKGSTFKVYLPRSVGAVPSISKVQTISSARRGTETVLVVEDEVIIRKLVRSILESNGYTVLEATSGVEALLICNAHEGPIHLVLTDVVMPQMSGPELALQWTARRTETRIIYMSGYTNNAIGNHGLLDRDLAFIEKPFTPRALEEKVREVLDAGSHAEAA